MQVKWIAGAALLATACTPTYQDQPLARGPLDGKTFAVVVSDDEKSNPDELIFKDGTFRSATRDRYGFEAASYTAVEDGDGTRFDVVAKSPKSGTMHWSGKVVGKHIQGIAVWDLAWWRPDRESTFNGKLK